MDRADSKMLRARMAQFSANVHSSRVSRANRHYSSGLATSIVDRSIISHRKLTYKMFEFDDDFHFLFASFKDGDDNHESALGFN